MYVSALMSVCVGVTRGSSEGGELTHPWTGPQGLGECVLYILANSVDGAPCAWPGHSVAGVDGGAS